MATSLLATSIDYIDYVYVSCSVICYKQLSLYHCQFSHFKQGPELAYDYNINYLIVIS